MNNCIDLITASPLTGQALEFAEKLIRNDGYMYHHCASSQGYMSRKPDNFMVEEYHGCFGTGYRIHTPSRRSNQYHDVTYIIRR